MYDKLKDMLRDELDRIQDDGDLNDDTLDHANKITHTLKSIATIEAMERSQDRGSDRYRDDRRPGRYDEYRGRY